MHPENHKALLDRLAPDLKEALRAAAALAHTRRHRAVRIEHWLLTLLDRSGTDLEAVGRFHELDLRRVRRDLENAIDGFEQERDERPTFSAAVLGLATDAWTVASIDYGEAIVRSGHLVHALVARGEHVDLSPELKKLNLRSLLANLRVVTADTREAKGAVSVTPATMPTSTGSGAGASSSPALDQFTRDLTDAAVRGDIDPVLGRDREIRQIIDILTRRRQNNPILTGEAGVGKTAVVEGFALRVAAGDVPAPLRGIAVKVLDLGLLVAGASVKGEFERRLKEVIDEVKASKKPVVLFIDEAHTLVGAGGQAGQGDAANLLKPALARGELRTIAATTWAEYKQYFESDAALTRRFQVVKVDEPDERSATGMMRGLVAKLEKHHGVRIDDAAVEEAVRLSNRYIAGRQLPDKCVSLLDTACARVANSTGSTPEALEQRQRRIEELDREIAILERETRSGSDHGERLRRLVSERSSEDEAMRTLSGRLERERSLVTRIRDLRAALEAPAVEPTPPPDGSADASTITPARPGEASLGELETLRKEVAVLQGETPLVRDRVDPQVVAEVVAAWTGIPVGRMVSDTYRAILGLEAELGRRIIGQGHALAVIAERVRIARARLADARKPIAVFLMAGPSGVGKTETAIGLAELLYGGTQSMTVLNMSEFKEEHKVSLLMGSPPGYVGYGKGGVLTEAVRRRPYSLVLLDEMEKAHPGVFDIFNQVFDKGQLRDGEGRDIDFKNTVVIMTSNAGADLVTRSCADPETTPAPEDLARALHPELLKTFRPEFLGRCTVIPYYPLGLDSLRKIADIQFGRIIDRIRVQYPGVEASRSDAAVEYVAKTAHDSPGGARSVEQLLAREVLPDLARGLLVAQSEARPIRSVVIDHGADTGFRFRVE